MKPIWYIALALSVVLGTGVAYLFTQQPKFYLGIERTGIALLKGRYRAWTWSWCDGWIPEPGGKMTPFCDRPDGGIVRGYRFIPRFRHTDMANFKLP